MDEALTAVDAQSFDAAVLDVNLAGEYVYSLVDRLTAKGVPCIFVTGYDDEAIDERFSHLPILQKPVNRKGLEPVLRASMKHGMRWQGQNVDSEGSESAHA